jgi:hypothetical protein
VSLEKENWQIFRQMEKVSVGKVIKGLAHWG